MGGATRRLPKDGIAFHAVAPALTTEALGSVIEAAAAGCGLAIRAVSSERYPSWTVGRSDAMLQFSANPAAPWSEIGAFVHDEQLAAYGSETLARLFASVSEHGHARLARTTPAVGPGFVQASELDGDLEFVDWWQFWSAPVLKRWGIEGLRAGPFHLVEPRANGACVLMLAGEPDDGSLSRKAAAEFLGIELRPVHGQLVPGKKFQIPWK